MGDVNAALGNLALVLSVIAWAAAQIAKGILYRIQHKKVDLRMFLSGGGMPSSHSACVCACATSVGMQAGFQSLLFAVTFILAAIIMYDASHLRKAAGEQAKILNYILQNWDEMSEEMRTKELKELLGHTNFQVCIGALLGIFIGFSGTQLAIGGFLG